MTTYKIQCGTVVRLLLLLGLVLFATACKSDSEKIEDTLKAYAQAVVVHRAPYNAYVHLSAEDKAHVSVEGYAASFEEVEPTFPAGTKVSIGEVVIQGDRAETKVEIIPPTGESQQRHYVLRRDDNKWRVWLGLPTLAQMRKTLGAARRLADDGAMEEAREKLEEVAASPFRASQPELIEQEAAVLRERLAKRERSTELNARLIAATNGDLELMKSEVAALSEKITPDDKEFYERLQVLRENARALEKKSAIEGFVLAEVRARAFRDAWGTLSEARFKATNNTGRPLSKLSVRVDLLNGTEGEEPVKSLEWELVEEGTTMPAGATVEVKREIEKPPRDWKNKGIAVTVIDLQFADEPSNDEG